MRERIKRPAAAPLFILCSSTVTPAVMMVTIIILVCVIVLSIIEAALLNSTSLSSQTDVLYLDKRVL